LLWMVFVPWGTCVRTVCARTDGSGEHEYAFAARAGEFGSVERRTARLRCNAICRRSREAVCERRGGRQAGASTRAANFGGRGR